MKPTPLEPKAEEHDLGGERARGQLRQQEHGELQGQEDGRQHEEPKRTGQGCRRAPRAGPRGSLWALLRPGRFKGGDTSPNVV